MERREWEFIKTEYSGRINCGDFELRPHWNGGRDPYYLRQVMETAVTEHNQHAALVEQRERLIRLLREVVPLLPNEARQLATNALAAVKQGEGRES